MGKMKFSSELIPASSKVLWNRFRIVRLEIVSGISFQNSLRNRLRNRIRNWLRNRNRNWLRNWLRIRNQNWLRNQNRLQNQNQLRDRSLFLHPYKNRRLSPIILRIHSRKESKFTCKRSSLMEIPGLITLLKLLISIQELMLIL